MNEEPERMSLLINALSRAVFEQRDGSVSSIADCRRNDSPSLNQEPF